SITMVSRSACSVMEKLLCLAEEGLVTEVARFEASERGASVARTQGQGRGREFESRFPLQSLFKFNLSPPSSRIQLLNTITATFSW
ncbi:hypothetical protein ACSZME_20405, partial [Aeromonas dhakensis]